MYYTIAARLLVLAAICTALPDQVNDYCSSSIENGMNSTRITRQAIKEDDPNCLKRWPNGKVPYRFDSTDKPLIADYIDTIKTAVRKYEADTCLKFEDITGDTSKWNQEHFVFQSASIGCFAIIGRWCNKHGQGVNLDRGCGSLGLVMHEMAHALGLYHQHVRPDRDKYVKIVTENIPESRLRDFEIKDTDIFDVPYDYGSLLHYGKFTASSNNQPTVETLDPLKQYQIGNPPELSHYDLMLLNRMYDCAAGCESPPECKNGGYVDKSCRCKCPHNTKGNLCETVTGDYYADFGTDCGKQVITTDTVIKTPNFPNAKPTSPSVLKCLWYLKAPKGKKAQITFDNFDLYDFSKCRIDAVDILADMYTVYQRFCGKSLHGQNITADSKSKSMMIYYTGRSPGWAKGFQASVTFVEDEDQPTIPIKPPPVVDPEGKCFFALDLKKQTTVITSPDYPKGKGQEKCEWLVTNLRNTKLKQCVKFTIKKFDMPNNKGCKNGYIKVDRRGRRNYSKSSKTCKKNVTFRAKKKISVVFKSNWEGSYKGFEAVFSKMKC